MKCLVLVASAVLFIACSNQESEPVVWKSIEQSLQTQLITVEDGGVIELTEGNFMLKFSKLTSANNKTMQF